MGTQLDSASLPMKKNNRVPEIRPHESRRESRKSTEPSRIEQPEHTTNAWSEFSHHVRGIHIDSIDFQPKRIDHKGSQDFNNVMNQVQLEAKKKARRAVLKRAMTVGMSVKALKAGHKEGHYKEEAAPDEGGRIDSESAAVNEVDALTHRQASRGWHLLRRAFRDFQVDRKKQVNGNGWAIISQTVAHLTDGEKAREVLYDRYLTRPHSWADGISKNNYPHFLFERDDPVGGRRRRTAPQIMTLPSTSVPRTPGNRTSSGRVRPHSCMKR